MLMGLNLGCGDAKAMGKRSSTPAPVPVPAPETIPIPTPTSPPTEVTQIPNSDRYRQGLDLGTQNGARMVEQIKRATIGVKGCAGQAAFEKAILAVTRSVRPPQPGSEEDLDLARGYFKGYSTTFRNALHSARVDCELPTVIDGRIPGTVVGSLLCGAGSVDVKLLDLVEIEPLYTGWTGGQADSRKECGNVAIEIAAGCAIGGEEDREKVERILNDQIALGCAD